MSIYHLLTNGYNGEKNVRRRLAAIPNFSHANSSGKKRSGADLFGSAPNTILISAPVPADVCFS